MSTAEIRRHWGRVAKLGCVLTGAPNPTIHHIHGGSCKDVGLHRSMGRKGSDWLVIPLAFDYHVGRYGIDAGGMSVIEWERKFGTQVSMLDKVCLALNQNLWTLGSISRNPWNLTAEASETPRPG